MKLKYTDYIIKGDFIDLDMLISKNIYVRIITIPLASTIAVTAIILFACIIPMTITVDGTRQVKLQYIKIKRKHKVNYVFLIPIDKFDRVLKKLNINFSLHNEIRRNEQNVKLGLLYVKNILLQRPQ